MIHNIWHKMYGPLAVPPPYIPLSKRKGIHITDTEAYCTCRRMWAWVSPLRRYLQPAILPKPLLMGQAMHFGLEYGYKASVGEPQAQFQARSAIDAFERWMASRKEALEAYTSFDHSALFEELTQLGKAMLAHYGLWVHHQGFDTKFELLGTERKFKMALPGTRDLAYEGRFDGLVRDRASHALYVVEFKTARSIKAESLERVFRGMQPSAYVWAAQQLYGADVKGVLYRVLYKRAPDTPTLLQSGALSKRKLKTTPEWYMRCLEVISEHMGKPPDYLREQNKEAVAKMLYELSQQPNQFFAQRIMTKTPQQVQGALDSLIYEGAGMANSSTPIYARAGYHCAYCAFKDPCDLVTHGYDDACEDLLAAEYALRDYWEYEVEGE